MILEIIEHLDEKFMSANNVPVSSIRLTFLEWIELKRLLEHEAYLLDSLKSEADAEAK